MPRVLLALLVALLAFPAVAAAQEENNPPLCYDDFPTTQRGQSVDLFVYCYDGDGDPVTYAVVPGSAAHGSVTGPFLDSGGGTYFTFTPAAGYVGTGARFAFTGSDGIASDTGEAFITVDAPPAPACSVPEVRAARSEVSYVDFISCFNADGFSVDSESHLEVTDVSFGSFRVTAEAGYTGEASFVAIPFTDDGDVGAPVTVRYQAGPDASRPPTCSDPQAIVRIGAQKRLPVDCYDPENDAVTITRKSDPEHGSAGPVESTTFPFPQTTVLYTAPANASGLALPETDVFTVLGDDGYGQSDIGTATITLQPETYNTDPYCNDGNHAAYEGASNSIYLTCYDAEDDPLDGEVVSGTTDGTLSGPTSASPGQFTFQYTPDAGNDGADSFTFRATDEHGGASETRTQTIDIQETPPPSCSDTEPRTVRPGRSFGVDPQCFSPYGPVTVAVSDPPRFGTVDLGPGDVLTYTADETDDEGNTEFDDTYTFTATGPGGSTTVMQEIHVTPSANSAPECTWEATTTAFLLRTSETEDFSFSCSDADEDTLTVDVAAPAGGEITGASAVSEAGFSSYDATYDPGAGFTGVDTVEVTADDGHGATATQTFTFDVRAADYNTAPGCEVPSFSGAGPRAGGTVRVYVSCSDGEDDTITVATAATTNATVEAIEEYGSQSFRVTIRGGAAVGPGSISLRPSDTEDGELTTAQFDVRAADANLDPSCLVPGGSATIESGETVDLGHLLSDCSDQDGDPLTAAITDDVDHGELTVDGEGYLTYVSDSGYVGPDEFTYVVSDDHGGSDAVTRHIDVSQPGNVVNTFIDSGPDDPTNDPAPRFTFRSPGRPNATFECRLNTNSGGPAPDVWEPCSSPFTPTGLDHGAFHLLEVRAKDAGETDDTPATHGFFTDFTAPGRPVLTQTPPASGVTDTATFAFTVDEADEEDVAEFACSLDGGTPEACEPPVDYTGLGNGSHTFSVVAVDFAGNRGEAAEHTWSVGDPGPGQPALTDTPAALTQSTGATFAFTGASGTASFECKLDGATFAACTSPRILSGLADGEHTFAVRGLTGAGTPGVVETWTWTVDTTPPPVPQITDKPAATTRSTSASFAFTGPGDKHCSLDGAAFAACTSPQAYLSLADGEHTFAVRAVDAAGNQSTAASHTWTVDTAGPGAPSITAKPAVLTSSSSAQFEFAGAGGTASLECKLDEGSYAACTSPRALTDLGNGSHTFSVRGLDALGNPGPAATHTWTVDTTAPDTTIGTGPEATTYQTTATLVFTGGTSFECKLDDGDFAPCESPRTYTGVAPGVHAFSARATDAAGNTDATPATREWTVQAPPEGTTVTEAPVGPSGGTVSNAPAGTAPSPGTPVVVAIAVPAGTSGGSVTVIDAPTPSGTAPSGFAFFGRELQIEAPVATAQAPLRLTFDVDAATLRAAGVTPGTLAVTRDNVAIAGCTGSAGQAAPDPCVSERTALAGGDARIVVLTSHASKWNLAKDTGAPETAITDGPAATTEETAAAFTLTATEAGTFECSLDGAAFAACSANPSVSGLAVGSHTFRARARDRSGNADASPAERSWEVMAPVVNLPPADNPDTGTPPAATPEDTMRPVITLKAAKQKLGTVAKSGLVVTVGCSEACRGTVTVKLGGTKAGTATFTAARTVKVKLSAKVAKKLKQAKTAKLTIGVTAEDAAGNAGSKSLTVTLKR